MGKRQERIEKMLAEEKDRELNKAMRYRDAYNRICAVYFLFKDQELVYVGSSTHMQKRLCSHIEQKKIDWDNYSYLEFRKEDVRNMESYYIRLFRPPMNIRECNKKWLG
jgi:hypothetical protein